MNTLLRIAFLLCFVLIGYVAFAQQAEYGIGTRYSDQLQNTRTANGQNYDMNKLTAAHRTMPFGTSVKVTRMDNKKSVVVRINDRGPFVKGHVVDLSGRAAKELGIAEGEEVKVKVVAVKSGSAPQTVTKTTSTKKTTPVAKAPVKKTPTRSLAVSKDAVRILKKGDKGYGVQVGYYASEANAMKYIEDLKKQWFKNISLNIDDSSGARRYKVILGDYDSRASAESYLSNLNKKDIKGFVVDMAKLKK